MAGAGNVIVFNGDRGILFVFSSDGNAVEGNWIGTDPAGAAGMRNATNGVEFIFGPSNNTVGGTAAGAANVIANNGGAGVGLTSGDVEGDAILSNSIYGNAGGGITLASGANQSQKCAGTGRRGRLRHRFWHGGQWIAQQRAQHHLHTSVLCQPHR